ncbi:unnamed protein product, partial [Rotaria sordida]
VYGKLVTSAVAKQYPLKIIRVIYDVPDRIGRNFKNKDAVPDELKAGVVYEATCSQCNNSYIGQTCRHLKTRINEHLSDQKKFLPQPLKIPASNKKKKKNSQNPIPLYSGPITRSRTGKLPSSSIKLYKDDIDELLKQTTVKLKNEQPPIPKSAIKTFSYNMSTGDTNRLNDIHGGTGCGSGQCPAGDTSSTIPTGRLLQYIQQQLIIVNVNYLLGGNFQLDGHTDVIEGGDTILSDANYTLDGGLGLRKTTIKNANVIGLHGDFTSNAGTISSAGNFVLCGGGIGLVIGEFDGLINFEFFTYYLIHIVLN